MCRRRGFYMFWGICFFLFLSKASLHAQQLQEKNIGEKLHGTKIFHKEIVTEPINSIDYIGYRNLLPISIDSVKGKKYKHNPVPVIAFGLTGLFVGAYVGSKIDPPTHIPGEFPEIFSTGNMIGAGAGALAGGVIGYILGKEEIKEKGN